MPKPFELSERTAKLAAFLRSIDKGQMVNYSELSRHVGSPVNVANSTYARLILQRDNNAVWVPVRPKIGLRRLTDAEIAERLPGFWLTGARNKLKRGGKQADVVELHQLNIDEQASFAVNSVQRELAFEALSKATARKMQRVARGTSNDLPAFTAIEWAISLSPRRARTESKNEEK